MEECKNADLIRHTVLRAGFWTNTGGQMIISLDSSRSGTPPEYELGGGEEKRAKRNRKISPCDARHRSVVPGISFIATSRVLASLRRVHR